MTLRSMGVEFPVAGDPTKVHGIITELGESRWRAECMACGVLLTLQDAPWKARASAIHHATGVGHRARISRKAAA